MRQSVVRHARLLGALFALLLLMGSGAVTAATALEYTTSQCTLSTTTVNNIVTRNMACPVVVDANATSVTATVYYRWHFTPPANYAGKPRSLYCMLTTNNRYSLLTEYTTGPIIQLGEVSTRTEVTGQIVLGPLVNLGTYHLDCQIPGTDAYFYFLLSSYVTEAS